MCLVSQSCPARANPWTVACPPGSFVHEDSPGNNTELSCHFLSQGSFPTQGWNLRVLCATTLGQCILGGRGHMPLPWLTGPQGLGSIPAWTHTHPHMYRHTHTHIHTCTDTQTHPHRYMHTHTSTHVQTHTHTHPHMYKSLINNKRACHQYSKPSLSCHG